MSRQISSINIGAHTLEPGFVSFKVWAPYTQKLSVRMVSGKNKRVLTLHKKEKGYFSLTTEDIYEGDTYLYRFPDGREFPDPASGLQPEGVHGHSAVVDHSAFRWSDVGWRGIKLEDLIIYELHVGTYTREGTFESIIPFVDSMKKLGVTAIEIMPVAQFPGRRNWGYDGVYPFAPQNTYGGPTGLKKLVNACHEAGLGVILDVVYNHFGPEGSYIAKFGPYFTDRYKTPWGDAINFDGPCSDEVRGFFIENALYWINVYHFDGLRIDAIHGIYDFSARHILEELTDAVHRSADASGRSICVITESDLNDVRVIKPVSAGGYGVDAQWNDDFHHALHALLTRERTGYYEDFGKPEDLAKAFEEGFVYSGQYSAFRKRSHGSSSKGIPPQQFVVFSQNHDQVGNRMLGDRLSASVTFEQQKLVASVVLLSPFIPLLFMGEEYGEIAPFCYFIDHSDKDLVESVRKGRREEFAGLHCYGEPPDPKAEETFLTSKLNMQRRLGDKGRSLLELYREVIGLRKEIRAAGLLSERMPEVIMFPDEKVVLQADYTQNEGVFCLFSFSEKIVTVPISIRQGQWNKIFDTSLPRWWSDTNGHELASTSITSDGLSMNLALHPWSALAYRFMKPQEV